MKNHIKDFPFKIAAAVLLISLNVSAEPATDIETDPSTPSDAATDIETDPFTPSDSMDGDDSETVTDKVTPASEGIEVVTPNGRHVLLKDDFSWEYLEAEQLSAEESALLEVVNVKDLGNTCDIGFRLTNNLPYMIRSLVPRFSVYNRDQLLFDTRSKSFNSIKPTGSQYQKVRFIGISCKDISHIKLHGGDRCTMGPFTKYDPGEGECLKRVYVQESNLMKVIK